MDDPSLRTSTYPSPRGLAHHPQWLSVLWSRVPPGHASARLYSGHRLCDQGASEPRLGCPSSPTARPSKSPPIMTQASLEDSLRDGYLHCAGVTLLQVPGTGLAGQALYSLSPSHPKVL